MMHELVDDVQTKKNKQNKQTNKKLKKSSTGRVLNQKSRRKP